jgi:DeoR/GlpR family transcriptional regulator of sugar metabolism
MQEEKSLIGKTASKLIKEGQTIFLGSGTTVLEIAHHLPQNITLTVISNSLPVINHLVDYSNVELIVVGGMFRKSELSMVGHIAESAIKEFRADQVFMGIHALDAHHGLTNHFLPETMTDRAIVEIAPRVVVVADHSKFGRVSTVLVAEVSVANVIVTDKKVPKEIVMDFKERGIEIILAK